MENYGPTNTNATTANRPDFGPTSWEEMNDEEKKKRATGICCYNLLGLVSTAAFICGVYSYSNCNFLARYVTLSPEYSSDDVMAACTNLGYDALGQAGAEICSSLLQDHGIGFDYWQATIPVNQHVCTTYLQPTPWGLVSPDLDTAFQAARVFSIIGYVFGGAAWLTLTCSSCCRMDQRRLKGIACYFWIACVFQGLSLIMFHSDICTRDFFAPYFIAPAQQTNATLLQTFNTAIESVDCGLSVGSKMAISACVLYFVCSLMVPFSIVPFYEQRQYQHEAAGGPTPTATNNGYSDGGPQPERGPPPAGQGPVVQGQNVEYSA